MIAAPLPPDHLLLALETSGDICSVAVLENGRFAVEYTFRHHMHLSEHLPRILDTVLGGVGRTLADVSALAVGIGPGSFTGTRIGVMTFKTFAAVLAKPIYGIDGLEALAAGFTGLQATWVVPILPCRTGVVFAEIFRVDEAGPVALHPPAALSLEELATLLRQAGPGDILFCGAAAPRYGAALRDLLQASGRTISVLAPEFPAASQVAAAAYRRIASGSEQDDPLAIVPLYIAPPPISTPKQKIPTSV